MREPPRPQRRKWPAWLIVAAAVAVVAAFPADARRGVEWVRGHVGSDSTAAPRVQFGLPGAPTGPEIPRQGRWIVFLAPKETCPNADDAEATVAEQQAA